MYALFDERHFTWPEQKRTPKWESKLPWVWFLDVDEARLYLRLWWIWQGLTFLVFVNVWFVHNTLAGLILLPSVIAAQLAFLRVWVPICKRADPPLGKWHWFAAGWWNPRARHCLLVARDLVMEGQKAPAERR